MTAALSIELCGDIRALAAIRSMEYGRPLGVEYVG